MRRMMPGRLCLTTSSDKDGVVRVMAKVIPVSTEQSCSIITSMDHAACPTRLSHLAIYRAHLFYDYLITSKPHIQFFPHHPALRRRSHDSARPRARAGVVLHGARKKTLQADELDNL